MAVAVACTHVRVHTHANYNCGTGGNLQNTHRRCRRGGLALEAENRILLFVLPMSHPTVLPRSHPNTVPRCHFYIRTNGVVVIVVVVVRTTITTSTLQRRRVGIDPQEGTTATPAQQETTEGTLLLRIIPPIHIHTHIHRH